MNTNTLELNPEVVRELVRESYGKIAEEGTSCCSPQCCSSTGTSASKLGYSDTDTASVPDGADLGLGCGNPLAIASLKPGDVVLDLGSGGGFDCFLATKAVAGHGKVIGIDMTPAMLTRARKNAATGDYRNVEFRLGEIENLPVADSSVDVIISNCVVNLSTDKPRVFQEAFRVLKPGGRLAISDIVALQPLPDAIRHDLELYSGCMAGASVIADLQESLKTAGFSQIKIAEKPGSRAFIKDWAPGKGLEDYVTSATIEATKPTL